MTDEHSWQRVHGTAGERGERLRLEASRQECRRVFRSVYGDSSFARDVNVPDAPKEPQHSGWPTGEIGGWCL